MALDQELSTWVPAALSRQAEKILDSAERLAQTRGFNGFSYADVADELGVTKASLHYHFASKTDLGRALLLRYHDSLTATLTGLDATFADPVQRLRGYTEVYASVLANRRMCLCGMLAAEAVTLPPPLQALVNDIFQVHEAWVAGVLEAGRRGRKFRFAGAPLARARLIVALLEGALLLARSHDDPQRFKQARAQVFAWLGAGRKTASKPRPVALRNGRTARLH